MTSQAPFEESEPDRRIQELLCQAKSLTNEIAGPRLSRQELGEIAKALECGGQLDFARFVYHKNNYDKWFALASSLPYAHMLEALAGVEPAVMPDAAQIITQKGLGQVYSMGPNPDSDKILLEHIVRLGQKIAYCAVDTNEEVVSSTLEQITDHLDDTFGRKKWANLITFGQASDFADVKSSGPSCVIYGGNTLMNHRTAWHQALEIAQKGGIVVASFAGNPKVDNYSGCWLDQYVTPECTQLNEGGLWNLAPELFLPKNRSKWAVVNEYYEPGRLSKHEPYLTPRISTQLKIYEPFSITISGVEIKLQPTRSLSEQEDWENPNSGFRQRFDNDKNAKEAIHKAYESGDFSRLPQECRKIPPIELIVSEKPYIEPFALYLVNELGMAAIGRVWAKDINYEKDGKAGVAASVVFSVERPASAVPPFEERGLPRPLPPDYPHDPAYARSPGNALQPAPRS